jgi:hypothetical protein
MQGPRTAQNLFSGSWRAEKSGKCLRKLLVRLLVPVKVHQESSMFANTLARNYVASSGHFVRVLINANFSSDATKVTNYIGIRLFSEVGDALA